MILNKKNSNYSKEYLKKIVDIYVDFKLQDNVNKNSLDSLKLEKILKKIHSKIQLKIFTNIGE
jgi:hypothetical protein